MVGSGKATLAGDGRVPLERWMNGASGTAWSTCTTGTRLTVGDVHWRRRSVALVTFAMIAANGGIARATTEMMTAARTE